MEHLFESETIESRIEDIKYKLRYIPFGSDVEDYYIFYKEDVQFLLELIDKLQSLK
jgi:hypothetical protein